METKINITNSQGVISAIDNGKEEGKLEFSLKENVLTIQHTYAYEKGTGTGKLLVLATIDYAKANGLKINPVCPYAKLIMTRTDQYQDILV